MAEFRNQVLILDDDTTLLEALKQVFLRANITAYATTKVSEAEEMIRSKPIGTVFVDCLMPDEGGVDFIQRLRTKWPEEILSVVLMSGIFLDSKFIKESVKATGAKNFLKKPFNIEEALDWVERPVNESTTGNMVIGNRQAMYSFFAKGKVTARDKRKIIDGLEEVHGFDLPFVYNLLVDSKSSGHLNVVSKKGDVFGITFAQGYITAVDIPDKATYLGRILVGEGYVDPADLEAVTKAKSNRRLGEELVQQFAVSPHAVIRCLSQQMIIRLSRTIVDDTVTLNFVEASVALDLPYIHPALFANYLHDWISSKISLAWLKAHFVQWNDSVFVPVVSLNEDHPAFQVPLMKALPGLTKELLSGATFGKIADSQKYAEETLLKAIHYLLTKGIFALSETATRSPEERLRFLKKLTGQFSGKNKLELFELILQIVAGSRQSADQALKDFTRMMGSAPPASEAEATLLHSALMEQSKTAFEFVMSGNSDKLRENMEKAEAEKQFKAVQTFEEAKTLLHRGTYHRAMELLKTVQEMNPKMEKLRLHMSWATAGLMEASGIKNPNPRDLELQILQIPPEEKLDAVFFFVQGLLSKIKGDTVSAKRHFAKALSVDPQMALAKRETQENKHSTASSNVLDKDLKEVFGSIFKRKSS